jgi:hypothetical protein
LVAVRGLVAEALDGRFCEPGCARWPRVTVWAVCPQRSAGDPEIAEEPPGSAGSMSQRRGRCDVVIAGVRCTIGADHGIWDEEET